MKFSQFCDMVENTEQEQQFLQFLKKDETRKALKQVSATPILGKGKLFTAIGALANAESIASFRQSGHYRHIMNWNINLNYQ